MPRWFDAYKVVLATAFVGALGWVAVQLTTTLIQTHDSVLQLEAVFPVQMKVLIDRIDRVEARMK